jgi:hypothetical protein
MRVPFHRRWALTLVPHALSLVVNNLRSQILAIASEGGVSPELIARRLREIDEAEEKFNREIPAEALAQVNSPLPSKVITSTLVAMTWRLVESTGPQFFITTDNPCFFFRSEGFGLGNDQSEFCLPLSTNYALHGCWQSSGSDLVHARVDQRTVREINRRLVSQTDRVAFYHKPAPWLFKILLKEELFLREVGGSANERIDVFHTESSGVLDKHRLRATHANSAPRQIEIHSTIFRSPSTATGRKAWSFAARHDRPSIEHPPAARPASKGR